MPVLVARPPRRLAAAAVLAAGLALAGCGGGGGSTAAAPPSGTTTGPRSVDLVAAVCAQETRAVPEVPDAAAPAAETRTYVRAVERAMDRLAPDLERLAAQDPARQRVLEDLARRMRAVAAVARRTTSGTASSAGANDLASTIAVLNVATTRERLLQCGV